MGHDRIDYPTLQSDDRVYAFTPEENAEIDRHIAKYPDKTSAVMPALWIAQEKFGWLPQKAIQLVADRLGLSYAHVYGVATFYTMYLKESHGKHLIELCTCFTCGECGGRELMEHAKKSLNLDEHGGSPDGLFWVREAECLGACDTPPVAQINNDHYRYNLTPQTFDKIVSDLRAGVPFQFESVPLIDQSKIPD